jgi:hypothetical protein
MNVVKSGQDYRVEPHHWTPFKKLPWSYCRKCGLISLKTPITAWATKKGCNYHDDPGWAAAVARLIPRTVTA